MYLYINTTDNEKMNLALFNKSGEVLVEKKIKAKYQQSEKLLTEIEGLMKLKKVKVSDLSGVGVVVGPGGFTSIRIGVATANAIAYSLNKPVADVLFDEDKGIEGLIGGLLKKLVRGKEFVKPVMPKYGAEPNIS